MFRLLDIPGGLWQLLRLGFISRFRFKGPYWSWRSHTAFGNARPASRRARFAAILHYAIWVHRVRRLR